MKEVLPRQLTPSMNQNFGVCRWLLLHLHCILLSITTVAAVVGGLIRSAEQRCSRYADQISRAKMLMVCRCAIVLSGRWSSTGICR